MTSHDSRSSHSTPSSSRGKPASSSEQTSESQFKSKYKAELATLKEIFPDRKEDDLISGLKEAKVEVEGLEGVIEHISKQPHWGEVKSKKTKKALQPASTDATPSSSTPSNRTPRKTEKPPTTQKAPGNRHPKPLSSKPVKREGTSVPTKSNDLRGSSWDKGTPGQQRADAGWGSNSNTTTAQKAVASTSTDTASSEKPKSWASLLKEKPKPEEKPEEPKEEPKSTFKDDAASINDHDAWSQPVNTNAADDSWNKPHNDGTANGDGWSSTEPAEAAPQQATAPATEADPWAATAAEKPNEERTSNVEKKTESAPAVAHKSERSFNQAEPVVLPNVKMTTTESLGVAFGSLNLSGNETEPSFTSGETKSQPLYQPPQQAQQQPKPQQAAQPVQQATQQIPAKQQAQTQLPQPHLQHHMQHPYFAPAPNPYAAMHSQPPAPEHLKTDPAQQSHLANPNHYQYYNYYNPYAYGNFMTNGMTNGFYGLDPQARSSPSNQPSEIPEHAGQDFYQSQQQYIPGFPYPNQQQASSGMTGDRFSSPHLSHQASMYNQQHYGYQPYQYNQGAFQGQNTYQGQRSNYTSYQPQQHQQQQQQQQPTQPNQTRPY